MRHRLSQMRRQIYQKTTSRANIHRTYISLQEIFIEVERNPATLKYRRKLYILKIYYYAHRNR